MHNHYNTNSLTLGDHPLRDGAIDIPGFDVSASPAGENSPIPERAIWPQVIKALPDLGFASIHSKLTGAWRAWTLTRAIDWDGNGKVRDKDLRAYTRHLCMNRRTWRRWRSKALKSGLLREVGEWLYYVRPAKAAAILGVDKIGYYASINANDLIGRNWRGGALVGLLATVQGKRPVSQTEIEQRTGISPRVQRYWLNGREWDTTNGKHKNHPKRGITRRKNIARSRYSRSEVDTVKKEFGYHIFVGKDTGVVRQRLPDLYVVPAEISKTFDSRRVRKDQKLLDSSLFCLVRRSVNEFRLYHEDQSTVQGLQEQAETKDLIGRDVFKLNHAWETRNVWDTIPLVPAPLGAI